MRFDAPPSPDVGRDALVGKLADRAKALAKDFEWPHSVYKALDESGIKGDDRKSWFSKVAAELKRRKRIGRLAGDAASSEAAKYEAEEREREDGEA